MLCIKNGRIINEGKIIEGKNVIIDGSKIVSISDHIPEGAEAIDARGNFVSPGFIDIHIHGAQGCDTMDGKFESTNTISKAIAKHGVTSFLSTTMTVCPDEIKNALKNARYCMDKGLDGANILGVHLEGPFLSKDAKGAHDEKYIMEPGIDSFINLAGDYLSVIKTVTIAPEIKGALDLIKFMTGHGIVATMGHSTATYDQAMSGIANGVSHATHLYNAMRGFNHREPGVVGAIFDSRITTEFIADGIHLHFAAIRIALAVKGYENCALITDAMKACCMEDGKYSLGGLDVYVKDGAARLSNGTLAGSTLTIDRAVRNVVKNTNLNMAEVVYMATVVPARVIKVGSEKGHIKPGYDADITIFDDDVNIKQVIVGGKVLDI